MLMLLIDVKFSAMLLCILRIGREIDKVARNTKINLDIVLPYIIFCLKIIFTINQTIV